MKIFGFEEDAKHYYIITELIEGRDLFDIFRERKRFEEKEAYAIFSQVCMATVYLHNRNIMHRDLKIENILYNEQAKLMKLIDFGSAIHFEDHEPKERKLVGSVSVT